MGNFKQTELGLIPENWELKTFKDICFVNQGLQIPIEKRKKHPSLFSKVYITIEYLNKAKEVEYIEEFSPSVCCSENDILMTRTGNTGIVITDVTGVFHNNFFKINYDKKIIIKEFLVYYLKQDKIKRIILNKAGTSTIPDLNHKDFYSLPISLPPTKAEQSAIAKVLSDADAWIQSLTQLIAKKRQIKQGAMQALLTGKIRIPGFKNFKNHKKTAFGTIPDDWEIHTIGDFIEFQGGSQPNKNVFSLNKKEGYIRLIQIRDYKTDKYKTYIPYSLARRFCDESDIMIGRYGPPVFQILKGIKGAYNVALIKAIPSGRVDKNYAYYYLKQEKLFSFIEKLSQRSSGQTGVDLKELKNYPLIIPPTINEQKSIASLLVSMDKEITELEIKLNKAKQIKQGMMQNLLTGRIRLI
ncbi:EcoKI restriction-modification system protein HsdS [Legionella sainthelensi]|uniref:EcoKI restriction-modification system protein HsdS n=2 Tax=Legionella sainthelensi TaxID=28087 RepID=A0A0W0YBM8_9GAMM|nr:EcoKI restriction-modification system protein HsdS [Legionella sainthelensi]VEH29968.1 EcoKI restriction-modification system protein HsdS [Legionella sainthelensi]